jgi:hypothetical protein
LKIPSTKQGWWSGSSEPSKCEALGSNFSIPLLPKKKKTHTHKKKSVEATLGGMGWKNGGDESDWGIIHLYV